MNFPAYQLVLSEIIACTRDERAKAVIAVPTNFLKLLLQCAVAVEGFDEVAYRAANPDIEPAIAAGAFVSGFQHFLAHGYFEGRLRGAVAVDEAWYLATYPDVAEAVAAGVFASASEHYFEKGVGEWRSPSPAAAVVFATWQAALRGEPLPLPEVTSAGPMVASPPAVVEPVAAHAAPDDATPDDVAQVGAAAGGAAAGGASGERGPGEPAEPVAGAAVSGPSVGVVAASVGEASARIAAHRKRARTRG